MSQKLKQGDIHLIKLIKKEQENPTGWATVSSIVCPFVADLPKEFVEFHQDSGSTSGRACLTQQGEQFVRALEWL